METDTTQATAGQTFGDYRKGLCAPRIGGAVELARVLHRAARPNWPPCVIATFLGQPNGPALCVDLSGFALFIGYECPINEWVPNGGMIQAIPLARTGT